MSTILLIHGAYQGGWIWTRVASVLRAHGHLVLAPSLDGCGERAHALRPGITTETHAAELADLLFREDLRDVIACGTSTGGMVLARLAEIAGDRLTRLVFADALVLRDGEAVDDIVTRPTKVNTALTTGPSREDAKTRLFAEMDAATREWTLARITQQPIGTMEAPVVLPHFWDARWNADVVWCRRSTNPPVAHLKRSHAALGGAWHELDTGHYPMLTAAPELAAIIAGG
ncbi:alpha/beta fold hydrolase [Plastoroseomonas arctica]|uniref:Alpha/beta hydrolase n=1 Tax=Plastoroseomonas arctica TaxID=1509237 RepID=A0AAF1JVW3_9PROT|nr:alpha/beta hydrolase [Plastoroseomonas arctica]MBR0654302.1 alpha/beta hydrolase [Plastoroseomonas arctica]